MAFTLDNVVPWGRSFEEYVRMLGLTENDLNLRILGCGDGPPSLPSSHGATASESGCFCVRFYVAGTR